MIQSSPQTIFPDACYIVEKYSSLTLDEINSILGSSEELSLPVWTGLNALKEVKSGVGSCAVNGIHRNVVRYAKLIGVSVEPVKPIAITNRFIDFVRKILKIFQLPTRPTSTKS